MMKMLRGYIAAGIIGALAWVLTQFGERFTTLVDMIYPYVIRTMQGFLATWSGTVDMLIWQVLAVALGVVALGGLVVVIVMKWNPISWGGWVLAAVSLVWLLHTAMFGLNYYAGPLADDIRLDVGRYSVSELAEATEYYRDKANELAAQVDRDSEGNVDFSEFHVLAKQAGDGFHTLTYDYSYPIFAGSTEPVKSLGWADMYTSMGITGFTCGITGEAAVNPQIPDVTLPFTMCHEMAHRMCIATERDANFAAFLAGSVHPDVQFEYSAYFMAYRYCYNALAGINTPAAKEAVSRLNEGVDGRLKQDMLQYNTFFSSHRDAAATDLANEVNDTYLKLSGDRSGVASYGEVCDLLVNWHINQVVLPSLAIEQSPFDPYDENQVDVSDIR